MTPPFEQLVPMLLTEAKKPFTGPEWAFEIKYDGYRILADCDRGKVQLRTRNGTDATAWFPEIVESLGTLPGRQRLDGEICVLDDVGRSDFDRLQARAKRRGFKEGDDLVAFLAFDILVAGGRDVMCQPWEKRKTRLEKVLADPPDQVRVALHVDEGLWLYDRVVGLGLEGMVAKRRDSVYVPGVRSEDWVKVKRPGAVPPERFKRKA